VIDLPNEGTKPRRGHGHNGAGRAVDACSLEFRGNDGTEKAADLEPEGSPAGELDFMNSAADEPLIGS